MIATEVSGWRPLAEREPRFSSFTVGTNASSNIFKTSTAWVVLPEEPPDLMSSLAQVLQEIRDMTGWAQRHLADVLGTSHTTIGRLETRGRATARSRAIATRAAELHAVLARLARVTTGPDSLLVALDRLEGGTTPLDLLRAGKWSQAYTAALDAAHGARPTILGAVQAPARAATREIRS